MIVTEEGMFIDFRDEHCLNALSPILVTDEGMVIEVRDEH